MTSPIDFEKVDVHRESSGIGLLCLFLFTVGLWQQPFVGFETRFALFAQEMWRHGISLFPTAYGEPYPDYPATSTILIWLFSLPFGAVTKLSAVLPTAIAAALNVTITYRLLARFSRQWAVFTVGFEILTVTFLAEARSISLDQMLATITLFSFYMTYTAHLDGRCARLGWLPVLLLAGFAIRGPLGVVIPAGVVCSYFFLSRQWKLLIGFGAVASAILFGCWQGLLSLTNHLYGADFTREVIRMQVAGRMDAGDVPQHFYYFISSLGNYAVAYPIAILVVVLLITREKLLHRSTGDDCRSLLLFLTGWILIVIAGLSIPHAKKARYLLPIVPAIAALAAYPLTVFVDANTTRAMKWLGFIVEKILFIFPLLGLVGLWVSVRLIRKHAEPLHLSMAFITALLVVYQVLAIVAQWRIKSELRTGSMLFVGALTILTLNFLVIEPMVLQLHDSQKFVREVEALRQQRPGEIAFFRVGKDAAAIKYLVNLDYDLQPKFFDEVAAVDSADKTSYLIVDDRELPVLQTSLRLTGVQPVLHDHFDHHLYTVFFMGDSTRNKSPVNK